MGKSKEENWGETMREREEEEEEEEEDGGDR